MSLDRNYRRARRVLGNIAPSVIEANRRMAEETARVRAALRIEIANGADARALYDTEPSGTVRRVVLLGVLRRGLSALEA